MENQEMVDILIKTWGPPGLVAVITIVGAKWFFKEYKEVTQARHQDALNNADDHKQTAEKMIQVVEKNAEASSQLADAVRSLEKKIGEHNEVIDNCRFVNQHPSVRNQ